MVESLGDTRTPPVIRQLALDQLKPLKGRNLSGCVFDGLSLARYDFSGCRLVGASFREADLSGTLFVEAVLSKSYFDGAEMKGQVLPKTPECRGKQQREKLPAPTLNTETPDDYDSTESASRRTAGRKPGPPLTMALAPTWAGVAHQVA